MVRLLTADLGCGDAHRASTSGCADHAAYRLGDFWRDAVARRGLDPAGTLHPAARRRGGQRELPAAYQALHDLGRVPLDRARDDAPRADAEERLRRWPGERDR